jgi:hypothetical protein
VPVLCRSEDQRPARAGQAGHRALDAWHRIGAEARQAERVRVAEHRAHLRGDGPKPKPLEVADVLAVQVGNDLDSVRWQEIQAREGAAAAVRLLDEHALLAEQELRAQPLLEDVAGLEQVGLPVEQPQKRVVNERLLEAPLIAAPADLDGRVLACLLIASTDLKVQMERS